MKMRNTALVAVIVGLLLLVGCSQDSELVEPLLFGDDADTLAVRGQSSEQTPISTNGAR